MAGHTMGAVNLSLAVSGDPDTTLDTTAAQVSFGADVQDPQPLAASAWDDRLSPDNPEFETKQELRAHYIEQAKLRSERNHTDTSSHMRPTSSCLELGSRYGVGVGLYFQLLSWLQCMFVILMVLAIPYLVVINRSVFTDEAHSHEHEYGVQKYNGVFSVYSTTFAAIVDDSTDNGTLIYMNTAIVNTWKGPMKKGTFLTWVSLVDTGATVLFFALIALCFRFAKCFAEKVDRKTLEVSDFSVLVCGLPRDVDAKEIGEFFSRYGKVMDVVVMKKMGQVLQQCLEVSNLEQRLRRLRDATRLLTTGSEQKRAEALKQQLSDQVTKIHNEVDGKVLSFKAAFVTFDSQEEQEACLATVPSGWLISRFMRQQDCFRGHATFWATAAGAPEDYLLENMSCSWQQLWARKVFVRVVVIGIILFNAAVLTKLCSLSVQKSSSINWKASSMSVDISSSMEAQGLLLTGIGPLSNSSNVTGVHAGVGGSLLTGNPTAVINGIINSTSIGGLVNNLTGNYIPVLIGPSADLNVLVDYCTLALPSNCTQWADAAFNVTLDAKFGSFFTWHSVRDQLIKERPLLHQLQGCTAAGPELCSYSQCLPCYCLGLELAVDDGQAGWTRHAEDACTTYINLIDIRAWGVRIGISLVIAIINYVLKVIIALLVKFEKRWTLSHQERSYAILCYMSNFCNTAVVLLVVNASQLRSATHSAAKGNASWLRYLWFNGRYDDFSSDWYEDVGLSILIVLLINCFMPVASIVIAWGLQIVARLRVLCCIPHATQADYNEAWAAPHFTLEQRVADVMLNCSLALLFGTGMPACYLLLVVVLGMQNLVDRRYLTRLCGASARYSRQLPVLLLKLLPWAAIGHCAVGLWMHTYFAASSSDIDFDSAVASANAKLDESTSASAAVTQSKVWHRITQSNGLAMLLLLAGALLWMLLLRHVWRQLLDIISNIFRCQAIRRMFLDDAADAGPTFEEALRDGGSCPLKGVPTYRLLHHPRYRKNFSGRLYRRVWLAAVGSVRYTRLMYETNWVEHPVTGRWRKHARFTTTTTVLFTANEADVHLGNGHGPCPATASTTAGGGAAICAPGVMRGSYSVVGSELSATTVGGGSHGGSFLNFLGAGFGGGGSQSLGVQNGPALVGGKGAFARGNSSSLHAPATPTASATASPFARLAALGGPTAGGKGKVDNGGGRRGKGDEVARVRGTPRLSGMGSTGGDSAYGAGESSAPTTPHHAVSIFGQGSAKMPDTVHGGADIELGSPVEVSTYAVDKYPVMHALGGGGVSRTG